MSKFEWQFVEISPLAAMSYLLGKLLRKRRHARIIFKIQNPGEIDPGEIEKTA